MDEGAEVKVCKGHSHQSQSLVSLRGRSNQLSSNIDSIPPVVSVPSGCRGVSPTPKVVPFSCCGLAFKILPSSLFSPLIEADMAVVFPKDLFLNFPAAPERPLPCAHSHLFPHL